MYSNVLRKVCFVMFFLFLGNSVFSQSDKASIENNNNKKAKVGTYQIIIKSTKMEPVFSDETFIIIESNRKENDNVTIVLSQYVDVFIPSRKVIKSKTFKPLTEFYYK